MEQLTDRLLSWASILDDQTRLQAERIARLPFIYPHVALMPDAHLGKGATVGSVVPTYRAIIPAAVGVDIGCVDAATEYLSPTGWRRISDYDGGLVMQYHPDTGEGEWVEPTRYVVRDQEEFLWFHTKYGVNQMLTPDHRVLLWRCVGRDRRQEMAVTSAAELADEHDRLKLGSRVVFETTFTPKIDTELSLTDAELRVQVMAMADGGWSTLANGHLSRRVHVHVRKTRKIERARKLLTDAGVEYRETYPRGDDITFHFDAPVARRYYDEWFWDASVHQLRVMVEESWHWDGHESERAYFTTNRVSANFMHYAFTATGYRATLIVDDRGDHLAYRVFGNTNTRVGIAGSPKTPVKRLTFPGQKAYCFTVPSGFLVLRRGGNVFTTGNCGMHAVLTSLTAEDLRVVAGGDGDAVRVEKRDLGELRESIQAAVPTSTGRWNSYITRTAAPRLDELVDVAYRAGFSPADYAENWVNQLGSLGSGNHFIELVKDERDRVWTFVHSGSRGVGNKIAQRHIQVARDMHRKEGTRLEDPDLAWLIEGTPEFARYVSEMQWAQRFAWLNRLEMTDRVFWALERWLNAPVGRLDEVHCHHNYTVQEEHAGKTVWLTRKGAIAAHRGTRGLIPGSMGAASYVVEGFGNPRALHSAPHGAGRLHSRRSAKQTFTVEELREQMEARGVEYDRGRAVNFLDEAPGAYKPIDQVMLDAQSLVMPVHEFRQLVNVKGD